VPLFTASCSFPLRSPRARSCDNADAVAPLGHAKPSVIRRSGRIIRPFIMTPDSSFESGKKSRSCATVTSFGWLKLLKFDKANWERGARGFDPRGKIGKLDAASVKDPRIAKGFWILSDEASSRTELLDRAAKEKSRRVEEGLDDGGSSQTTFRLCGVSRIGAYLDAASHQPSIPKRVDH